MKETPILFTPENAQKSYEGLKTQTRRIITPQPISQHHIGWLSWGEFHPGFAVLTHYCNVVERITCPYGTVGDRLYCKEVHYRWGKWERDGSTKRGREKWRFHCDQTPAVFELTSLQKLYRLTSKVAGKEGWQKRSPLFMPKAAARLWLELTGVRVERVQEITAGDCIREGIPEPRRSGEALMMVDDGFDAIWAFRDLWTSINGPDAWERNDWVWVLDFKKVQP